MKILVVGNGGREHALCWALRRSAFVEDLFCAPGNPGIAELADCLPVSPGDTVEIADVAENLKMDLTIVGPELPLSLGIADEFAKRDLPIFGPSRLASQIESSKVFAKEFFRRHGIPTAHAVVCSTRQEAEAAIRKLGGYPVVLKADGLAGGKGVLISDSREEADRGLSLFFDERVFGSAGDQILVEEFLEGSEASFMVVCDGENAVSLPTARDYKKVYDGDRGPNTGGMGSHSPAGIDAAVSSRVLKEIIWPALRGLAAEGRRFRGVLYAGLMLTGSGPKVLEFNARFGDPETEVILPRLESDLAALLVAATRGELERFPPLEVKPEACVGVVLCSAGYPGTHERGKSITGLNEAARMPSVELFHAGTAEEGGRLVTAGGRVLVATATGSTMSEAAARAYEAADRIEFEGKHMRRDIAGHAVRATRV